MTNRKNLDLLIERFKTLHEHQYDQTTELFDCGTPACIMGHIKSIMIGVDTELNKIDNFPDDCEAQNWLGLDDIDFFELVQYSPDNYVKATLKEAIKTLEHLKETGDVRWFHDYERCYDCGLLYEEDKTFCCQDELEVYDSDGSVILGYISGDLRTRCEKCYDEYLEEERQRFINE